jgi:beta-glucanase (GH16 family)
MKFFLYTSLLITTTAFSQRDDPYKPSSPVPRMLHGMMLVWNDEFISNGKPDTAQWTYENGFVRNNELQWYQPENATCMNGVLIIEGRREKRENPNYKDSSNNWKTNRKYIEYTASSLKTQGLQQCHFGRIEVRARVDTSMGAWPAIWTLGIKGRWPLNGEVDIMEFYRVNNVPNILANLCWGSKEPGGQSWNTARIPLSDFISNNKDWPKQFHVWRMDWDTSSISLYLDEQFLNTQSLETTLNPDGSNPFLQPQYLLLNLAIGANGGDPANTKFPIKYEVDYVRYYKKL